MIVNISDAFNGQYRVKNTEIHKIESEIHHHFRLNSSFAEDRENLRKDVKKVNEDLHTSLNVVKKLQHGEKSSLCSAN